MNGGDIFIPVEPWFWLTFSTTLYQEFWKINLARLVNDEERWNNAVRLGEKELLKPEHYRQVVGQPIGATPNLPKKIVAPVSGHFYCQIVDIELNGVIRVSTSRSGSSLPALLLTTLKARRTRALIFASSISFRSNVTCCRSSSILVTKRLSVPSRS